MVQVARGVFDANLSPHIYNWRPGYNGNMRKLALAMAKMPVEGARVRAVFLGTSKMNANAVGTFDGTDRLTNAINMSKTRYAEARLKEAGIATTHETVFPANGLIQAPFVKFDPRLSLGANWIIQTGTANDSIGGGLLFCNNGLTGTMSFSPNGTIDTVEIYTSQGVGRGVIQVSDGATVLGTIDQYNATTPDVVMTKFSMTRGSGKVINFNRTAARALAVDVLGIVAYDSTVPAVDFLNIGRAGAISSRYTVNTNPWSAVGMLNKLAPNVTFYACGANDMGNTNNIPVATFKANADATIKQALLLGDVVIMVESLGTRLGNKWGTAAIQQSYVEAMYELARENDIPLINENGMLGDYDTAGFNVYVNDANNIHENASGNWILSAPIADIMAG